MVKSAETAIFSIILVILAGAFLFFCTLKMRTRTLATPVRFMILGGLLWGIVIYMMEYPGISDRGRMLLSRLVFFSIAFSTEWIMIFSFRLARVVSWERGWPFRLFRALIWASFAVSLSGGVVEGISVANGKITLDYSAWHIPVMALCVMGGLVSIFALLEGKKRTRDNDLVFVINFLLRTQSISVLAIIFTNAIIPIVWDSRASGMGPIFLFGIYGSMILLSIYGSRLYSASMGMKLFSGFSESGRFSWIRHQEQLLMFRGADTFPPVTLEFSGGRGEVTFYPDPEPLRGMRGADRSLLKHVHNLERERIADLGRMAGMERQLLEQGVKLANAESAVRDKRVRNVKRRQTRQSGLSPEKIAAFNDLVQKLIEMDHEDIREEARRIQLENEMKD